MNQQKSKEYTEKLFKSQDKRWNMQRKATRDKWDRKRDFFDELTAWLSFFATLDKHNRLIMITSR